MMELIQTFNFYLATGGVMLLLAAVILMYDLITKRALAELVAAWGMLCALVVTSASVVMTLVYSDVFGFIPCGLCWLQRIFLYPQVVIIALALVYKDKMAARYGIALSLFGIVVGLYQHYLQMGGSELVGCPTAGVGADCAKQIMLEYGFITFPMLSVILFTFLIVLYVYLLHIAKSERTLT